MRLKKFFIILGIVVLILTVFCGVFILLKEFNLTQTGPTTSEMEILPLEKSLYSIVDTGQIKCFNTTEEIRCDSNNQFPGQDANYQQIPFSYRDVGNGTIIDNNTGLMWQASSDLNGDGTINIEDKRTYSEAVKYCEDSKLVGITEWRLPDIKTLYSLMNFRGTDPVGSTDSNAAPFISTDFFDFGYGDQEEGERQIDAQWATSSLSVSNVMDGKKAMFGLNLADGRIKAYPTDKLFYLKCVRGNPQYGENSFRDNGDGTVLDLRTNLMWMQGDSQETVHWQEALQACDATNLADHGDWRLPNAKELHSIVDYTRSPEKTGSPAIDPIFGSTSFVNEMGEKDWGYYWTSTTHKKSDGGGTSAVYISFGRALGYMTDPNGKNGEWMDVHGAGAQRSDPKIPYDVNTVSGDQFTVIDGAIAHGPQGDIVRGENYYRCVRGVSGTYNGHAPEESSSYTSSSFSYNSAGSDSDPGKSLGLPPQEAVNACTQKDQNESCSFQAPDGTIRGKCLLLENTLACVPAGE